MLFVCAIEQGSKKYEVHLETSDKTDGTFTDVPGGAFADHEGNAKASTNTVKIDSRLLKGFVRVNVAVTGGTGTSAVTVLGIGLPKYG